jgi:hypothetical protein
MKTASKIVLALALLALVPFAGPESASPEPTMQEILAADFGVSENAMYSWVAMTCNNLKTATPEQVTEWLVEERNVPQTTAVRMVTVGKDHC